MREDLPWRPRARGNGERSEARRLGSHRFAGAIRQRRYGVTKNLSVSHRGIVVGV